MCVYIYTFVHVWQCTIVGTYARTTVRTLSILIIVTIGMEIVTMEVLRANARSGVCPEHFHFVHFNVLEFVATSPAQVV